MNKQICRSCLIKIDLLVYFLASMSTNEVAWKSRNSSIAHSMIHFSVYINTLRLTPSLIPLHKFYLTDLLPHVRHRNDRFEPQAHKRIIYESRDVFSGSKILFLNSFLT